MHLVLSIIKPSPFILLLFILALNSKLIAQNNEIKDCNGKPISVQTVMVRSTTGVNLMTTNCIFSNGSLSAFLNCIKTNNPSLPSTASLIVELTADPASGISGTDLSLLKQEVLQINNITNTCNKVGSDTDLNYKLNTIDLCLIRKHNLGISNINPTWKFYKSQNLSLTGIGATTDLVFPIVDFPLSPLSIIAVHNGNVNQVTTTNDTCVLLCKPNLIITPGQDEVRKLTTDYFLLNKSCNFPNLSFQILNASGQIIGNDITQNQVGSQLTAQLKTGNTTQTCTTKLSVYPCEVYVNIDVDQTNITDSSFVDVSVRNGENLTGYQLSLNFDTTHLQFIKIEKGSDTGFNVVNDAHYNGKGHVNISRFNESQTLGLANGTRLFRIKFKRKSTTVTNVIVDPENVETLFFDSNKNEYCADITYVKDTKPPVCIKDTINILASQTNGFGIVKFTDYASDDFGTVFFVGGIDEFDFPITNLDTFNCGTNILTYVTFKDANGQSKQCIYRVIVNCPDTCSNKFLYFDGVNDRINIANQHTGNVEFTIECWFKSDNVVNGGTGEYHRIFTLGSSNRLEIGDQLGRIIVYYNGAGTVLGPNIRDNLWHHLSFIRDVNKLKVYLDGIPLTVSLNSPIVDIQSIRVGYFNNSAITPGTMWKGGIDEIKLWNYGLSQEEIINSKNKINTKKKDCGLIGYWRMEEGIPNANNQSITMIKDSIKNNHGTLVGFDLVGSTSNFTCNDSLKLMIDNLGCCRGKKPKFENCPANIIGYVGENCTGLLSISLPVAIDPCNEKEAFVGCARDDNKSFSSPYSLGNTTITCIAIASNSLRDTCSFTVEVRDTIKPKCTIPSQTLFLGANGQISLAQNELNFNPKDNCAGATTSFKTVNYTCNDLGVKTITATVTDIAGNTNTCSTQITIRDTIRPTCTISPLTLNIGANGQAVLTQNQLTIVANDICAGASSSFNTVNYTCNDVGVKNITATVRDLAGNTNTCSTQITIRDTIRPICIIRDTIVTSTDGVGAIVNFNGRANDNCAEGLTLSYSQPSGQLFTCGDYMIIMTATDKAGNKTSCSFKLSVRDCEGCCRSEQAFLNNTNVMFDLTSQFLSARECIVEFLPPKMTTCQRVKEINWGEGTVSRGTFTNTSDFLHQYLAAGLYDVCVTYEENNGTSCYSNKICATFEVLDNCTLKRSSGSFDLRKILLYPNPTQTLFYISAPGFFSEYQLINSQGQILQKGLLDGNGINVSDLNNGVYTVLLKVGNEYIAKPLIKM